MKNETIVQKAIMIANETNTIYIRNGAGRRMTEDVKEEFMSEVRPISARYLKLSTADENTFGFSDTGLIIGALCRFKGNPKHFEGGTSQRSAAPFREMTADSMIKRCTDVTEDFDYIRPGELLWTNGHVGLYIGNGQAVEATESWDDGVQITGVAGICDPDEPKQRRWKKHGKMPWVEYRYPAKQNYIEIADQVLRGEWGIKHEDIREHLKAAGYNDRLIFQEMAVLS